VLHRIPPPYGRSGQERDDGSFDHEKGKRKSFFAKLFD
jgi:hypothetical protein